jgi:heterodisulfide reductase subunit A
MIKGIEMSKKNPTLGVFLCNCGGTISKVIDFKELAEFVSKFEDIKFVKEHGFLCGEEGLRLVADAIRNGVERIVIVACSPKLYEPMFKECMAP